ncbi:hypothetical protein RvY_13747 [Ramazzottius varieornatus]|uniref:Uncharacterized protein n=1 Tax=Ramazzottius varieornatus TaxID=947166 RepID=A0A1D1VSZ9_RAMVA|nr:hypothetical protein RvY_13747 [Ramazzottius varieornatus]
MAALRRGILLRPSLLKDYSGYSSLRRKSLMQQVVCRAFGATTVIAQKRKLAEPTPMDMEMHVEKPVDIPADERELGQLVYVGSISNQITRTKYISFLSSILGIALQPELLNRMDQFPVFAKVLIEAFCGFFVFVTPLLIHALARQYVLRMYYDPDTENFNAVTFKFLPRKQFTGFSGEDVQVPAIPGMFTSFTVTLPDGTKKSFFINPPEFRSKEAYIKLMGYDKPMDIINGPQFGSKDKA